MITRRLALGALAGLGLGAAWLALRTQFRTSSSASPRDAIGDALEKQYPRGGGEGYALPADAALEYVYVLAAGDHWVYVTAGRFRAATPHEFVMRVFGDAGGGAGAWKHAPLWPVRVLTELAGVELRTQRDFKNRDDLTNLRFAEDPQPPYRHFAFSSPDRTIPDLAGPSGPVHFVRVIPLTDAQKDQIVSTGKLGPLADWYARDPLMRVP